MRVVIPAVGYTDMLAETLPAWRDFLPPAEITLVTSPSEADRASVALARVVGARALVTDCWTRWGAVFNKGLALDLAFGFVGDHAEAPGPDELCLAIDADVVPFGIMPAPHDIAPRTLYGCPRYSCPDPATLREHRAGLLQRAALALLPPRSHGLESTPIQSPTPEQVRQAAAYCLGYFQLFRYAPGLRFGSSHSAAGYDMTFGRRFRRRLVGLTDVYVLHLGPRARENWSGRVLPAWGAASA